MALTTSCGQPLCSKFESRCAGVIVHGHVQAGANSRFKIIDFGLASFDEDFAAGLVEDIPEKGRRQLHGLRHFHLNFSNIHLIPEVMIVLSFSPCSPPTNPSNKQRNANDFLTANNTLRLLSLVQSSLVQWPLVRQTYSRPSLHTSHWWARTLMHGPLSAACWLSGLASAHPPGPCTMSFGSTSKATDRAVSSTESWSAES